jgi:tripartite-type tricarboxylate transporter receptor subunit TctC
LKAAPVIERFAADNAVAGGGPPAEFAAFIRAEQATWSDIVRRANIRAD